MQHVIKFMTGHTGKLSSALRWFCLCLLLALCAAGVSGAEDQKLGPGQVQIPLTEYVQLTESLRAATEKGLQPPAGYALGDARVRVEVEERGDMTSAKVEAQMTVRVLSDKWELIPLLPAAAAVERVEVDNQYAQLSSTPQGLCWSTRGTGTHNVVIRYSADARRSDYGYSVVLPMPQASAINLTARIPRSGVEATVIPGAGLKLTSSGDSTTVTASIPAGPGVQLSWRTGLKQGLTVSRAAYSGKLNDESVAWSVEYQAELNGEETANMALLPSFTTVSDVKVDGRPAAVIVEGNKFVTTLKGRGPHKVTVDFETAVKRPAGPPLVELPMSGVPISKIDFTLPGRKEVAVDPSATVTHKTNNNETVATIFVPITQRAVLTWTEAVPEEIKQELRANTTIYHAVHAEEGVLSVHGLIDYEVTRGETNLIEFTVPKGVDINHVSSKSGGIADWRLNKGPSDQPDAVSVFLDRQLKERILLDVHYDKSLPAPGEKFNLPLLRAKNVHRERGMLALLSGKELTLRPIEGEEHDVTHVGENQLPAFVREDIKLTVAHTYKYMEGQPSLNVQAVPPEKKQGRFDAVVNTLVSLGDVTIKGAASIDLNIKAGAISEIELELPAKVNLLSLTAPSLRAYKANSDGAVQKVGVQFTQDMEGQFRIEANYELIVENSGVEIKAPALHVKGAEVEQGRIAVEALSVMEVQPATIKALSSLDLSDLPQQLVLKTTNPILLAYKYVRAEPGYELGLKITRHREVEVQTAAIDSAAYKTLYTRDGLAVTAAQFFVRNTGKQFLRVELPAGAKVWSASVNGNPEKPALAESPEQAGQAPRPQVLIKMINSARGFAVQLVYQAPVEKIATLGLVRGTLPRPDMVVTNSIWDVYLPDGISYGRPETNMDLRGEGRVLEGQAIKSEMKMSNGATPGEVGEALPLVVPSSGVGFRFEKLYANESAEDAYFSMPYGSGAGQLLAWLLVALAAGLVCLAIFGGGLGVPAIGKSQAVLAGFFGAMILGAAVGYYGMSYKPAIIVAVAAVLSVIPKLLQKSTGAVPLEEPTAAPVTKEDEPGKQP